jgi:L-alanine-DL-glutamate epimerase-like enolase superfamily enzyme
MNTATDIEPTEQIPLEALSVSAYRIPTETPESDGTIEWDSTTMVLVRVKAGNQEGIGYTYADASAAYLIRHSLADLVVGKNALDVPQISHWLWHQIRNNGDVGIGMMAVSAVDNALWDLKAKLLGLPLCLLLGRAKDEMLLYGSGGFTSYTDGQLREQLGGWAAEGLRYVKMKIGREPERDAQRVKAAREAIGDNNALFVDANGALTVKQAIAQATLFSAWNITWFEEPVRSDNPEGLRFIREHLPDGIDIAAGEYGYNLPYFKAMLAAGAVDVLQADATRCGGISGFLKAGILCEAWQLPFSSHCAPSLHLHAALALPAFWISEYFFDHVRIEEMLFDGVAKPVNGALQPDLSRPGLGLEFKEADARPFEL